MKNAAVIIISALIFFTSSFTTQAVTLSACDSEICNNYFNKFYKSAKRGHPRAMALLGELYYHGYGTPKNQDLAIKYYKKAARKGITSAQYKAGLFYLGNDKHQNISKGIVYLKQAAKADYKEATYLLGVIYFSQEFGEFNLALADKYLAKAHLEKHPEMFEMIGHIKNSFAINNTNFPYLNAAMIKSDSILAKNSNFQQTSTETITVYAPTIESLFDLELLDFRSTKPSLGSRLTGVTCENTVGCKTAKNMRDLGDMTF